jgi:hypothetical protein
MFVSHDVPPNCREAITQLSTAQGAPSCYHSLPMPDEPTFRYAIGSGRDPGPMLDGPENMTMRQALKAFGVPWYVRLYINALLAVSNAYGFLTRPLR